MNNWCIACDRKKRRNQLFCDACEKKAREEAEKIRREWKGDLFKRFKGGKK